MKKSLLALAVFAFATVAVAATLPRCGVVEGFYGRPWGTEGRKSMLEFMGKYGMNTFVYGPKDDPYHHRQWRDPYPQEMMTDFRLLLTVARRNHIDFYWTVHLGGTFCEEPGEQAERDTEALFRKLEWMYAAGFRAFGIFYDDFGKPNAEFHAALCNRVIRDFLAKKGDCAPLLVCPNIYWGYGDPYQQIMGEKLYRSAMLMWTGGSICSDIRASDVEKITADFRRPPFIWLNWPANDYCRSSLLLGRFYGVDDCQFSGVVANPMENCEANKIALASIATWAKNTSWFDSDGYWKASFAKLYSNPKVAEAMAVIAEHNSDPGENGHEYRREESRSLVRLYDIAKLDLATGGVYSVQTALAISNVLAKVDAAAATLLDVLPVENPRLDWEMRGWLEDERYLMAEGFDALRLQYAKNVMETHELLDDLRQLRRDAKAAGDRHVKKFREKTFENDRINVVAPKASPSVLRPMIEELLVKLLLQIKESESGTKYDLSRGFSAFSTVPKYTHPTVFREDRVAGISRMMEPIAVGPGETFGFSVPDRWIPNYFHARFDNARAKECGAFELSRDGVEWKTLEKKGETGDALNMQLPLDVHEGWRWARYRNVTNDTVMVKAEIFKFDVAGELSPIDELLK